jgi:hypothetical protein
VLRFCVCAVWALVALAPLDRALAGIDSGDVQLLAPLVVDPGTTYTFVFSVSLGSTTGEDCIDHVKIFFPTDLHPQPWTQGYEVIGTSPWTWPDFSMFVYESGPCLWLSNIWPHCSIGPHEETDVWVDAQADSTLAPGSSLTIDWELTPVNYLSGEPSVAGSTYCETAAERSSWTGIKALYH